MSNPTMFVYNGNGSLAFQDRAGGGGSNILPVAPIDGALNSSPVNAVTPGKLAQTHCGAKFANLADGIDSQLGAHAAPNILSMGDDFHVVRVDAAADSAQMVDTHAVRYGAIALNPVVTMRLLFRLCGDVQHAVAGLVDRPLPYPAWRRVAAILNPVSLCAIGMRVVARSVPDVLTFDAVARPVGVRGNWRGLSATTEAQAARVRRIIGATIHVIPERRQAFPATNLVAVRPAIGLELWIECAERKRPLASSAHALRVRLTGHCLNLLHRFGGVMPEGLSKAAPAFRCPDYTSMGATA